MRSTQFIGLNKYAEDYVKNAIKIEYYDMTKGMFEETIEGRIFYLPNPWREDEEYILKEVVQDEPWSSGPMIFTCLQDKMTDAENEDVFTLFFCWMKDPSLHDTAEVDYETGRYWV